MSSRCRDRLAALLALVLACTAAHAQRSELRVCLDPDNLPYSHANGSGFENRIAQLIADEMKRPLVNHWLPQRRGFVRKSLGAHECDVWIGVPADLERVLPTRAYYRSRYVFVTRADDPQPLRSFDDPRLRQLRIGVQLVGNDLSATPAGHALASRGAVERVFGFTVDGSSPAAQRIVQALADGQLDAAVAWGPQVAYFAQRTAVPMRVAPALPPPGLGMPFEYAIAMGVRRGDTELRDALNAAIEKRRADIDAILGQYAVPRTDAGATP